MALRVFNTLTRKLETFEPVTPGRVGMYVCGVTVYDDVHLGHARGALAFEIIRRYLQFKGYSVKYVRNLTDVDDKIIQRAQREGVPAADVADRYIKTFYEDMRRLGVPLADVEPRATEHVPGMVEMIQGLIEKGFAYAAGGDVYFSVRNFEGYGSLSGKNPDDLQAGARVEVSERKQDPLDFALWKTAKPGEPSWDSPWGKGRPGWHIECSVMSIRLLGGAFDIHGGGEDLIFPHHENERAQSCAFTGGPPARYWLHNGLVRIHKEKMSKSTGLFFALKTVLEKFHPEVVRFLLAGSHYRSPLEYSEDGMKEAWRGLDRLYNTLLRVEGVCARPAAPEKEDSARAGGDPALEEAVGRFETDFTEAMDTDFNTPRAIGAMFTLAHEIHGAVDGSGGLPDAASAGSLRRATSSLVERARVLTVLSEEPGRWVFHPLEAGVSEEAELEDTLDEETIERLIRDRQEARARKDWSKADRIRDELKAGNIVLEDGPTGTQWKRVRA
ncbi:MAG: cysteine--tRNA ligase [Nitrospinota bacterium]